MIGRVFRFEIAGLRRTGAVPLTVLFAMGGGMLGRSITWLGSLLADPELPALLQVDPGWGGEITLPLTLLAFVIATAYVYGHDLADGTLDVLLTSPVRREAIVLAKLALVLAWVMSLAVLGLCADALVHWALSFGTVDPGAPPSILLSLTSALAAFAGLPIIAWVALRFRGVLVAIGSGIALFALSLGFRRMEMGSLIPWNAPYDILAATVEVSTVVGPLIVLGVGTFACLWEIRRLDL